MRIEQQQQQLSPAAVESCLNIGTRGSGYLSLLARICFLIKINITITYKIIEKQFNIITSKPEWPRHALSFWPQLERRRAPDACKNVKAHISIYTYIFEPA